MGSSCFSRGNNHNIEVIQEHLGAQTLPEGVELTGHLCEGHCKEGPNVTTYMRKLALKKANALIQKMPSAVVIINEAMRIIAPEPRPDYLP